MTILIHGAAGGVGSYASQIAKNLGARVIGTAASADLEYLKSLGVDELSITSASVSKTRRLEQTPSSILWAETHSHAPMV